MAVRSTVRKVPKSFSNYGVADDVMTLKVFSLFLPDLI